MPYESCDGEAPQSLVLKTQIALMTRVSPTQASGPGLLPTPHHGFTVTVVTYHHRIQNGPLSEAGRGEDLVVPVAIERGILLLALLDLGE